MPRTIKICDQDNSVVQRLKKCLHTSPILLGFLNNNGNAKDLETFISTLITMIFSLPSTDTVMYDCSAKLLAEVKNVANFGQCSLSQCR